MRAVLPLLVLALAACDPFLENRFPRERHVFEVSGKSYAVLTQFDPILFVYINEVTNGQIGPGLTEMDGDAAVQIVEEQIGGIYCEHTGRMELARFGRNLLPAGGNVVYLETRGMFVISGRCEYPDIGL